MKKYGLITLLMVCFLISLPAVASNQAFDNRTDTTMFVQIPESNYSSLEEITTINSKGEVATQVSSENVIHDVNSDILLLEICGNSKFDVYNMVESCQDTFLLIAFFRYPEIQNPRLALVEKDGAALSCFSNQIELLR